MSRGAKKNVEIRQGSEFYLVFRPLETLAVTVLNPDGTSSLIPAKPLDLTGASFRAQFRVTPGSVGPPQADATPDDFSLEDIDGKQFVVLHLSHVKTAGMTATKGFYDVEVTLPDGQVFEVLYGEYTLYLQVTLETP